jgi:hypothetical protein
MTKEVLRLTKIDAARRQLETALQLWFSGAEPVSIYTLAYAAHELIFELYRKAGLKDLLFDTTFSTEEYRAIFVVSLKRAANFFKHANKDLDEVLEFTSDRSDPILIMSVVAIHRLGLELTDLERAFIGWFGIHHRTWGIEAAPK